ncbi:GntR family transcriptional regulator [Rhizobium sp. ERR 1071]|uniref:GntR family transcriptional regulator n=1 Tax=Rhizobium sp. ERR 1071 TaxID=2572677 RepID=UPI001199B393|nr:GntR family transcriptional regulator [Rhizobium sp. ERR1071]TWB08261.1 GntR family transcriptional regulator [Rhizobium sp. ERR1071]
MFGTEVNFFDERSPADRFKTAQIYHRLKELLLFQKIPPRTKLDIGALAHRLRVSKTPVREALIMLAEERIIQVLPGSGYFSKALKAAEIAEDYEVAFAVLKHIITAHIRSFAGAGLPRLTPEPNVAHDIIQNVGSYAEFIEELLEAIVSIGGNELSLQMIRSFNCRTAFIRQLDLQQPVRFAQISSVVEELIERLEHADTDGAIDRLERLYKEKIALLHHLVAEGNRRAMASGARWEDLVH